MEKIDIKKELIKSVIAVVRHKEFYGHVVQQFEKVFVSGNHRIDTAAVGRFPGERFIKLIYNEDYFRGLYAEQFTLNKKDKSKALRKSRLLASGATEHEILHVVFGHLGLDFHDKKRANVAMDCVVNQNIPKDRIHKSWIMPERYGLPNDKSSKWYYENLKGNAKYKKDELDSLMNSHSLWKEIASDPLAQEFLKDIIRKAKDNTSAEGWGKLSGNVKEAVDRLLEWHPAQVPWQKAFRDFCASSEETTLEYTMSRTSVRFGTRPGIRKKDHLRVAVIVDTSLSICEAQLKTFFNEVRWIWRNGAQVHIFEADVDIQNDYRFSGKFKGEVCGRGGTCLSTPLIKVDKMRFDCIVYFTDFWASKIPKRPRTPVLWVLSSPPSKDRWPCNWGKAIEINNIA